MCSDLQDSLRFRDSVEIHKIDDIDDTHASIDALKTFIHSKGPNISYIFDDISCLTETGSGVTPFGFFQAVNSELQELGDVSYWPLVRGSILQESVAKFSGIAQLLVSVESTQSGGTCIHPLKVPSTVFHRMLRPYSFDPKNLGLETVDRSSLLLNLLMQKVVEVDHLKRELRRSEERYHDLLETTFQYKNIVGRSEHIRDVCRMIGIAAASDATVLIQGESGTGKELVAEAIHFHSARSNGPFIKVNCAALSETLLASELFGHRKGAFTGASRDRKGKFRSAQGGTILLDEIGCLLPAGQAKLLRVLQEKEIEPVGESVPTKVDVRIIVTTNIDLKLAVKDGRFREDLYYRLNVFPIWLSPLRERMDDLPLLARHFLKIYSREMKKTVREISPTALSVMASYGWPGNVRELENAIEYAVMMEKEDVLQPFSLLQKVQGGSSREICPVSLNLRGKLEATEKQTILEALSRADGVKSAAARLLGIDPRNLSYFLKKHGISRRISGS
jgi:transcriptional regulator with GAF, ATPase, and Fis domain